MDLSCTFRLPDRINGCEIADGPPVVGNPSTGELDTISMGLLLGNSSESRIGKNKELTILMSS